MGVSEIFLMAGVGIITGIFAGVFGVGGGIILVPALVFLFKYTQQAATATSLVALLLPVGLLGVYEYHRAGRINGDQIKVGLIIAVGLFFGTYFGARLANTIPTAYLQKAFSLFLMFIAYRLWFTPAL